MAETFDLILKGGAVVNHDGVGVRDVAVRDGVIVALGSFDVGQSEAMIDCAGLHVLPGVIDSQVHFREPGMEQKEDLQSGSLAAVMGGVTSVFEMPNTSPLTTSESALADKVARARNRMHCDFAFYVGGTADNHDQIPELERLEGSAGIKVFIGSSTGDLLVDDQDALRRILSQLRRRAAFHCEDETRLNERKGERVDGDPSSHPVWRDSEAAMISTRRLVELARSVRAQVHVLHISTAEEMRFLAQQKDVATCEATPQHLTLAGPEIYDEIGTLAQMNPPLRDERHRDGVWWGVTHGVADVLGSDHAPHTLEEKAQAYPASPSGMPGVQTLVPVMLDHVNAGRLSIERFVDLTSHGPGRIFQIAGKGRIAAGYDADFTVVDLKRSETITNAWSASKCGWTPYDGRRVTGWPVGTVVRGRRVMWEGSLEAASGGAPVRFLHGLAQGG